MLKALSLISFIIFTGISCQKKQVPKVPVITEGSCGDTVMLYLFFQELSDEQPSVIAPTPRGCRCAIMIDGKEYVASEPEESYVKCLKTTP